MPLKKTSFPRLVVVLIGLAIALPTSVRGQTTQVNAASSQSAQATRPASVNALQGSVVLANWDILLLAFVVGTIGSTAFLRGRLPGLHLSTVARGDLRVP